MLELPQVTLCCIDTVNHLLAMRALRRSTAGVRFARTLFITDRHMDESGIDCCVIDTLATRDAYSRFLLKTLLRYVDTPYVLIVQWDGYVVNPSAWRDDFLDCDYLGAKWHWRDPPYRVGNGGFSLRSRRLLVALQDPRIELTEAEDATICLAFRDLLEHEHGIRFGTERQADAFSFEAANPVTLPFGFHGLFNFYRVVSPDEFAVLVREFTPSIARSLQLMILGRNCLAMGYLGAAASVFRRILEELPGNAMARDGLAKAEASAGVQAAAGRNEPCFCGSGKRYKHCHGAVG